ncbi:MAG: hypothetical protein ISS26_06165 [Candidatus Omnitrophica bacterium]|nr:hypothetical protein [Candidatus Omnitrophota bacterium]
MTKKFLLVLMLISVAVFYLANDVFAQDIFLTDVSLGERINLGLNCSVVLPTEDESDAGIYVGGLLSYDILKYLAVGIESGYVRYDYAYQSIKIGTLNGCPLLGDVILKAPVEMGEFTLTPYGVVGTGVLFSSFDESSIFEALGYTVDTETAFLMKFGGGIDFYVTDNIALNFEGSYYLADIDIKEQLLGQTYPSTIDADAWFIGGGAKIRF